MKSSSPPTTLVERATNYIRTYLPSVTSYVELFEKLRLYESQSVDKNDELDKSIFQIRAKELGQFLWSEFNGLMNNLKTTTLTPYNAGVLIYKLKTLCIKLDDYLDNLKKDIGIHKFAETTTKEIIKTIIDFNAEIDNYLAQTETNNEISMWYTNSEMVKLRELKKFVTSNSLVEQSQNIKTQQDKEAFINLVNESISSMNNIAGIPNNTYINIGEDISISSNNTDISASIGGDIPISLSNKTKVDDIIRKVKEQNDVEETPSFLSFFWKQPSIDERTQKFVNGLPGLLRTSLSSWLYREPETPQNEENYTDIFRFYKKYPELVTPIFEKVIKLLEKSSSTNINNITMQMVEELQNNDTFIKYKENEQDFINELNIEKVQDYANNTVGYEKENVEKVKKWASSLSTPENKKKFAIITKKLKSDNVLGVLTINNKIIHEIFDAFSVTSVTDGLKIKRSRKSKKSLKKRSRKSKKRSSKIKKSSKNDLKKSPKRRNQKWSKSSRTISTSMKKKLKSPRFVYMV